MSTIAEKVDAMKECIDSLTEYKDRLYQVYYK